MLIKILAWFLYAANSDPFPWKQDFYRIKNRILREHGKKIGHDLQYIKKMCWTCDGSGEYDPATGERCYNCAGTGIYKEFWVILEVYRLGKYQFHLPVERFYKKAFYRQYIIKEHPEIEIRETITDYIQHKTHRHSVEALLWLFLLYDPKLFLRKLGRRRGKRLTTPMEILCRMVWYGRFLSPRRIYFSLKWRWSRYFKNRKIKQNYYEFNDDVPF